MKAPEILFRWLAKNNGQLSMITEGDLLRITLVVQTPYGGELAASRYLPEDRLRDSHFVAATDAVKQCIEEIEKIGKELDLDA